jgi:RimJ/RimL family protein N-acetyltransferase
MNIRLATPADARALAELRYTFRSLTDQDIEPQSEFLRRCIMWMADRLQRPSWSCWIAEQEDETIGALWLQLIEKIPNPTSEPEFHAYITNVFVNKSSRGQGIGSRLLTEALTFCKEQSVHAVILWPNEKSRTLYERHGFAVRSDLFELVLEKALR